MPTRPKLIYLAERSAALTREQFTQRWRRHFELARSRPRWRHVSRYIQCDVLTELAQELGTPDIYEGSASVWYRSVEAHAQSVAETSSQRVMEADEVEVFSRLVRNFAVLTEERVLRGAGDGQAKLHLFLRRAPDVPEAIFRQRLVDVHAPLLLADQTLRRYVQSIPIKPEAERQAGLPFDLVEELWFDGIEQLAASCRRIIAHSALRQNLRQIAHDWVLLPTNENVLYRDERTDGPYSAGKSSMQ